MLFKKKSFKNKIRQDFSELFKLLDNNNLKDNSFSVSNKYLAFGEKLNFVIGKKQNKKTFNIPYFDTYRDLRPDLLTAYYFNIYFYYRNLFEFSRLFIYFLFFIFVIFFFNKYYRFIFAIYTLYFIDIIYNLEDLLKFFKNIFS